MSNAADDEKQANTPIPANYEEYNKTLQQGDDRTGAYLEYAKDLLENAVDGEGFTREHAVEAYQQLMTTAQISSYSGAIGGAAIYGNYRAQQDNEHYEVGLDKFSKDVAERIFEAVAIDAKDDEQNGYFTAGEIRALAYSAWDEKDLAHSFPGNLQRGVDSRDGYVEVNFGEEVMDKIFDNDPGNYMGHEVNSPIQASVDIGLQFPIPVVRGPISIDVDVGVIDPVVRAGEYKLLAPALGNLPTDYGFTQEQMDAVAKGGEPPELANGLSLHFETVKFPDGEVVDHLLMVKDADKVLNVMSDLQDGIYNSAGRSIDVPDTEGEKLANELENLGMPYFTAIAEGLGAQIDIIDMAEWMRDREDAGLPKLDSPYRTYMADSIGDDIKDYTGADTGEYGVRLAGGNIEPFKGFIDRKGYDLADLTPSAPSVINEPLQMDYREVLTKLHQDYDDALEALPSWTGETETVDDAIRVGLPHDVISVMQGHGFDKMCDTTHKVEVPADTPWATPLDRVRGLTQGLLEDAASHDLLGVVHASYDARTNEADSSNETYIAQPVPEPAQEMELDPF